MVRSDHIAAWKRLLLFAASEKRGTLEPWNVGTSEPWNLGTLEPRNVGTLERWNVENYPIPAPWAST